MRESGNLAPGTPNPTFSMAPLVYEINTRCWLRELSDSGGTPITLATVPDSEFQRWWQLGFTHVWLMGVWTTGPRSRAVALAWEDVSRTFNHSGQQFRETDIAGSPYAIAEYRVSTALGGEDGLRMFRQKLHQYRIKLLLDFVPNHVGLDHRWLKEHPEFFVQGREKAPGTFAQETNAGLCWIAHGKDPNFPPWSDTAQLDYRQPTTRVAIQEELLAVAERCDGVRCDLAMLSLNEVFEKTWAQFPPTARPPATDFWSEAMAATKRIHPGFLFMAEVYWGLEARLQSLGFDYTYDKELYDLIVRRSPSAVQQRILSATPHFIAASAHFLENHDELRIASILSSAEHRAAALLILALPGMRLLHDGQLTGAQFKLPVQWSRCYPEDSHPEIGRMYEQLLRIVSNTAIGRGKFAILKPIEAWPGNPTAQNFMLIQWQNELPVFHLAVINLAPHRSQCYAPLAEVLVRFEWVMKDLLGPEKHNLAGDHLPEEGVYFDLPAHGAQLFEFAPARRC
jgi:hypothetical protein